jgi:protein TonB
MFAYIGKNLKYPEQAVEEGIEGIVYLSFVVETDGKITGVTVLRGIGGGCNEEALRVVRSMPNWTPGKQGGKPVRVKYNLPIRFKLAADKK